MYTTCTFGSWIAAASKGAVDTGSESTHTHDSPTHRVTKPAVSHRSNQSDNQM